MKSLFNVFWIAIMMMTIIGCSEIPTEYTLEATDTNNLDQLATPTNLNVEIDSSGYIQFTWDPVSGAGTTTYDVYKKYSDDTAKTYVTTVSVNQYSDTTAYSVGDCFDYYVMAKTTTGTSSTSTVIDSSLAGPVTIDTATAAIPAPTIAATDGIYVDKVVLTWNRVKDPSTCEYVTSYEVYRAEYTTCSGEGTYSKIATIAATDSTYLNSESYYTFDDETVEVGSDEIQYYVYYVIAVNGKRHSVKATTDTGYATQDDTTPNYKIATPSLLVNATSSAPAVQNIVIEWGKVYAQAVDANNDLYVAAESYDIYRSTVSAAEGFELYTNVKAASATTSSYYNNRFTYTDSSSKEQGLIYYYRIIAKNSTYNVVSSLSAVYASGWIADMPTTSLSVSTDSQDNVNITWSEVANTADTGAYVLYYITSTNYNTLNNNSDLDDFSVAQNYLTLVTSQPKGTLQYYWTGYSYSGTYRMVLVTYGENGENSITYSSTFFR